jgi:hypothetical protein
MLSTYGFPIVLSIYLIIKIEYFIGQMVENQRVFGDTIAKEIREMKNAIVELRIEFAKK